MALEPEEIFFRAFRHAEFDISELSLSSFTLKTARGENAYIGVPAFPSRAFRHTAMYIRTDGGIHSPADLKGRRVGVAEYQLTACVWVRAFLEDDFGVKPSDIHWIQGGIEEPGRPEKLAITLPAGMRMDPAPDGTTLSGLLASGAIDALMGHRVPSCFDRGHPHVGRLFPEPRAAAADYFKRTGIFPIMHLVGVRRALVEQHPWLPATVLKAFERAKAMALSKLGDTSAPKVMLPFVEEQLQAARELMGQDFWPYGVAANRPVLEAFLRHHHRQGLSPRLVSVEELFHPATLETPKI
jgi:4,5-dihydroxyphthalate decarboxylase